MASEFESVPLVPGGMARGPGGVTSDTYLPPGIDAEEYERLRKRYLGTSVYDRAQQVLWAAGAAFVLYFGNGDSDLASLLLHDPRVRGWARNAWAACFLANVVIYLYVAWVLYFVRGQVVEFEEVPWSIPVATAVGVGSMVFFCLALWPVFGILTVPIFVLLFMGMMMLMSLVPGTANKKED